MASIPTNAFSAPRVRWVMQHQLMKEEQEKHNGASEESGMKNLDQRRKSLEPIVEGNVEPVFKPGKIISLLLTKMQS